MFCFRLRIRHRKKLYVITISPQAIAHYLEARTTDGPGSRDTPEESFSFGKKRQSVSRYDDITLYWQVEFCHDWIIGVQQDVKSQAVCEMQLIATPYPQD